MKVSEIYHSKIFGTTTKEERINMLDKLSDLELADLRSRVLCSMSNCDVERRHFDEFLKEEVDVVWHKRGLSNNSIAQ